MGDYSKLTVAKLREELDRRGLPKTGLKAALVQRLDEADEQPGEDDVALNQAINRTPADEHEAEHQAVSSQLSLGQGDSTKTHLHDLGKHVTENQSSLAPTEAEKGAADSRGGSHEDGRLGLKDRNGTFVEGGDAQPRQDEVTSPMPIQPVNINGLSSTAQPDILPGNRTQSVSPAGTTGLQLPTPTQTQVESVVGFPSLMSTQTSIAPEELADDSRKRKRRSQSPPPSSVDTFKRLRSEESTDTRPDVKLPEDSSLQELPTDIKRHINGHPPSERAKSPTTDTTYKEFSKDAAQAARPSQRSPTPDQTAKSESQTQQPTPDRRFKSLTTPTIKGSSPPPSQPGKLDRDIPPSLHPATNSLYIRNLMRPLQPAPFKAHLITLAHSSTSSSPSSTETSEIIKAYHVDPIRTHAFVQFASITHASRVRANLHEQVWPNERDRKPLWVDFIPEGKVPEWIDVENQHSSTATGRTSTGTRWEIVYEIASLSDDKAGEMKTYLQEVGGIRQNPQTAPNAKAVDQTAGAAPLGERSRPSQPVPTEDSSSSNSREFKALDDLFASTTAKPKLYYLPVAKPIAEKRLALLDAGTGGGRSVEMRRFTFEEGAIVDKGPEFGRGLRGRGRGADGGYRGRGGGGYRGGYRSGGGGADGWRARGGY